MNQADRKIITWFDVKRILKLETKNLQSKPDFIKGIEFYSSQIEINTSDIPKSTAWLKEIFPANYSEQKNEIISSTGEKSIKTIFINEEEYNNGNSQFPLWKNAVYNNYTQLKDSIEFDEKSIITAFHSFKGGVGRTTSLATFAFATLEHLKATTQECKVLLIDADIEAPGITFWMENDHQSSVSFIQFLEAIQYSKSESLKDTVDFFASELKKSSFFLGDAKKEVFVLPSANAISDLMDIGVLPEHIARNNNNPWLLTNAIYMLAESLNAKATFIDLRAGISEISSPIILDNRIERFFVTTTSTQSLRGITEIISKVRNFSCENSNFSVILNFLTDDIRKSENYQNSNYMLSKAAEFLQSDDAATPLPNLEIIESEFQSGLMSISSMGDAFEKLQKTDMYETAKQWAKSKFPNKLSDLIKNTNLSGLTFPPKQNSFTQEKLNNLYRICETFQYSEKNSASEMLITEQIRNLGKHFENEPPNAVCIGAKGSGKTFTYLQICRHKDWSNFIKKISSNSRSNIESIILPALCANNLDGETLETNNNCFDNFKKEFKTESISAQQTKDKIRKLIRNSDTDWINEWQKLFAELFNNNLRSLTDLNEHLIVNNKSATIIIDGIEDIFSNPNDEYQKAAISALLEIPNILKNFPDRKIGFICFIREDYVRHAVQQNTMQLMARYKPFKLDWDPESFLRLACWIAIKAEALKNIENIENLEVNELSALLEKLWGKKMGRDNSKEANTSRWVYAVLCDLKGALQARDIVRFLKFASKHSLSTSPWDDRLLHPDAIRRCITDCSQEKIIEASEEIPTLKAWVKDLESISREEKTVPFDPQKVGLSDEAARQLKEMGVFYDDFENMLQPNSCYLPEIYRIGLKFTSSQTGRPRVQALLKKNLGKLPF